MAGIQVPLQLVDALKEGRLVLFVGAGLSAQAGLPTGPALAGSLRNELERVLDRPATHGLNDASLTDLADYFEQRADLGRAPLIRLLEQQLGPRPGAAVARVHQVVARLPWKYVITTNFDSLLERAFEAAGQPYRKLVLDTSVALGTPDRLTLLKLHGDLDVPESLIIARRDYDDFQRKYPNMSRSLSFVAQQYVFLFAGYGLTDPDFQQIWSMVHLDLGRIAWPSFALTKAGTMPPWQAGYWKDRRVSLVELEDHDRYPTFFEALGAAAGVAGIPQPTGAQVVEPAKEPRDQAEARWRRVVQEQCRWIDPSGIFQFDQVIRRGDIELERIYVQPTLRSVAPDREATGGPEAPRCPRCGMQMDLVDSFDTRRWKLPKHLPPADRLDLALPVTSIYHWRCTNPSCIASGPPDAFVPSLAGLDAPASSTGVPPRALERMSLKQLLAASPRWVLLGEPGVGKTTLLQFLAFSAARGQAGESLGLPENLLPLPIKGDQYADALLKDNTISFYDFVRKHVRSRLADVTDEHHSQLLEAGRIFFLVDGLDEIPERAGGWDENMRRRVSQDCHDFMRRFPACRFILASRPAGYRAARLVGNVPHAAVNVFDEVGRADLVRRWFDLWHAWAAEGAGAQPDDRVAGPEAEANDMLGRIREAGALQDLLFHPLLLTIALIVYRVEKRIPERRVEYYEHAVRTITQTWERAKRGRSDLVYPPVDQMMKALSALAYRMHVRRVRSVTPDVFQDWLVQIFVGELSIPLEAARAQVAELIRVIEERLGLLVAAGAGLYGFVHLTFQEYLAGKWLAGHLAEDGERTRTVLAHLHDSWWEEPIRLAVAMAPRATAEALIRAILNAGNRFEEFLFRDLRFAARCLADLADVGEEVAREILQGLVARVWLQGQAEWALGSMADVVRAYHGASRPLPMHPEAKELARALLSSIPPNRAAATLFVAHAGIDDPDLVVRAFEATEELRDEFLDSCDGPTDEILRQHYLGLLKSDDALGQVNALHYFGRRSRREEAVFRQAQLWMQNPERNPPHCAAIAYLMGIGGDAEGLWPAFLRAFGPDPGYWYEEAGAVLPLTPSPRLLDALETNLADLHAGSDERKAVLHVLTRFAPNDPRVVAAMNESRSDPDEMTRSVALSYFRRVGDYERLAEHASMAPTGQSDIAGLLSFDVFFHVRDTRLHQLALGLIQRGGRGEQEVSFSYLASLRYSDPAATTAARRLLAAGPSGPAANYLRLCDPLSPQTRRYFEDCLLNRTGNVDVAIEYFTDLAIDDRHIVDAITSAWQSSGANWRQYLRYLHATGRWIPKETWSRALLKSLVDMPEYVASFLGRQPGLVRNLLALLRSGTTAPGVGPAVQLACLQRNVESFPRDFPDEGISRMARRPPKYLDLSPERTLEVLSAGPGEEEPPAHARDLIAGALDARLFLHKYDGHSTWPGARYADPGDHPIRVAELGEAILNASVAGGTTILRRLIPRERGAGSSPAAGDLLRTWRLACLLDATANVLRIPLQAPYLAPPDFAASVEAVLGLPIGPLYSQEPVMAEVARGAKWVCRAVLEPGERKSRRAGAGPATPNLGGTLLAALDLSGAEAPWDRQDEAPALYVARRLFRGWSATRRPSTKLGFDPVAATRAIALAARARNLPDDTHIVFHRRDPLPFLLVLCRNLLVWNRPWRAAGGGNSPPLFDIEEVIPVGLSYDENGDWCFGPALELHFECRFRSDIHGRTGFRRAAFMAGQRLALERLRVGESWFPTWDLYYHFDDGTERIQIARLEEGRRGIRRLRRSVKRAMTLLESPGAGQGKHPAAVALLLNAAAREAIDRVFGGGLLLARATGGAAANALVTHEPGLEPRDRQRMLGRLTKELTALHARGASWHSCEHAVGVVPHFFPKADPSRRGALLRAVVRLAEMPRATRQHRAGIADAVIRLLPHLDAAGARAAQRFLSRMLERPDMRKNRAVRDAHERLRAEEHLGRTLYLPPRDKK